MYKLTARDKDVILALSGLQFHEHASLNMSSSQYTSVSGKEFVKKCNGKNSPRTMLHLYSQNNRGLPTLSYHPPVFEEGERSGNSKLFK